MSCHVMYVCMYVCMHVYICKYVYMYVYICIYKRLGGRCEDMVISADINLFWLSIHNVHMTTVPWSRWRLRGSNDTGWMLGLPDNDGGF